MRLPVLNAIVWKVIAELFRRHAADRPMRLVETHPGISLRGCLHVQVAPGDPAALAPDEWPEVTFYLGGQEPGTYEVFTHPGAPRPGGNFVEPMLEGDPVGLLDTLDRFLGLRTPAQLPPSTPQVLAVRLIAQVLAQESFARVPLRATMGRFNHNGESGLLPWTQLPGIDSGGVPPAVTASSAPIRWDPPSQRVAIHAAPQEGMLQAVSADPFAVVDSTTGELHLMQGHKVVRSDGLAPAYQAAGSRLGGEVARVLAHLGR